MRKLDLLGHDARVATATFTVTFLLILSQPPPNFTGFFIYSAAMWAQFSLLATCVVDEISREESVKYRHRMSILLICSVTFIFLVTGVLSTLKLFL